VEPTPRISPGLDPGNCLSDVLVASRSTTLLSQGKVISSTAYYPFVGGHEVSAITADPSGFIWFLCVDYSHTLPKSKWTKN